MNSGKYVTLVIGLIVLILAAQCYKAIPAGHVGVATLFGEVNETGYPEGFHFPVNPLYNWHVYDMRQKTHKEAADVPSQDQLLTKIDISVQYRAIASEAPNMLKNTGTLEQVVDVHLVPNLRSVIREQGKTVKKAEEFFLEETQTRLQSKLEEKLVNMLKEKGLSVESILIRDIQLPNFINVAIQKKKEREQEAEKQKAELMRFKTEQEQKIALAEAEKRAAQEEAEKKKILADANAYEIQKINQAIANNPAYIKLKALEALQHISKDPAAKVYFLNGESTQPLPLMHIGETDKK